MRLLFANGPGDVVSSLDDWDRGVQSPSLIPLTYSGKVFDFLREGQMHAQFISQNARVDELRIDRIQAKNSPKIKYFSWLGTSLSYHISQVAYGLFLWREARRFGADIAIVDSGSAHWFVFALFGLSGIRVVPNFHNTYENPGEKLKPLAKVVRLLDRLYFNRFASYAMGVSTMCRVAIDEHLCQRTRHWELHSISYRELDFKHFRPNPPLFGRLDLAPFRLLFVGRLEKDKGALDLPEVISQLLNSGINVVLEVCGDGRAISELRSGICQKQLENRISLVGRLGREELLRAYGRCHAVIVPSHLSFREGFPAVCAEACLALRPVISSRVSNAKERLGEALLLAEVENISDFARQISTLATDPKRYQLAVDAAIEKRAAFTCQETGMGEALSRLLRAIRNDSKRGSKAKGIYANSLN